MTDETGRFAVVTLTEDERDWLADVWGEETTVSAGAFYPVVARIIAARLHDERQRLGTELLRMASSEFAQRGAHDPRGAGIWDSGSWVREKAGLTVNLGRNSAGT